MTSKRRPRLLPAALAVLGVAVAMGAGGCDDSQTGDLAATKFGDLAHRLPQRQPALAELQNSCGLEAPAPEVLTALRRRPYLQRLTSSAVDLVWTADEASAGQMSAVVTNPDGSMVAQPAAVQDQSAHPPDGAAQWIAAVTGLQPGKAYCYQVRSGDEVLARAGFRTPPAPRSGGAVRFVAIGDSGTGGSDQKAVLDHMFTVSFDLMLHTGDIAYASGTRWQLERFFFGMYGDLLGSVPAFPASGNHEYETEDAAPYREAFVLPENGGPAGHERWYSYDYGDVHFVVLDTEKVGPAQAAWLDADLTANQLPWTIVYMHRPAFSSGDHGSTPGVQQHFVPLFSKHRVPLVLAGHDHHYERTQPVDGVTYVVTAGAGAAPARSGIQRSRRFPSRCLTSST